jgi:hypothetical protein
MNTAFNSIVYGSTLAYHEIATSVPVTPIDRSVSTITNTPEEHFNAFGIDEKSRLECYRQTMEHKLKGDVFRKLKCITKNAIMEFFYVDPHAPCQYICNQMNIRGLQQGPFWTSIKNTVKRMIEKQQSNNATYGCKKSCIGKKPQEGLLNIAYAPILTPCIK